MNRAARRLDLILPINPLKVWRFPVEVSGEGWSTRISANRSGADVCLRFTGHQYSEEVELVYNFINGDARLAVEGREAAVSQILEASRRCMVRRWLVPGLDDLVVDEVMRADPKWRLLFCGEKGKHIGYAGYRGLWRVAVILATQKPLLENLWIALVASHIHGAGAHG